MGTKQNAVSIGEWILTFILLAIPLVNIIMLFVWAFGGGAKPSKMNYARATLLLFVIIIALYILILVLFGSAIMGIFSNMN